eukprot:GHVT01048871.1.p1 GENE.GHVT01048871.1~~GHVT01048871.1.p1  ORF type:complete len:298 (+),score=43.34 GHVT01048871.1:579-1472(+)
MTEMLVARTWWFKRATCQPKLGLLSRLMVHLCASAMPNGASGLLFWTNLLPSAGSYRSLFPCVLLRLLLCLDYCFQFVLQLSEGMTSPVPSVLPFGNLLGDDKVVESDSLQGDLDGPVSLNNPMSIVTGPLELLGAPFELLGGSPPLETLMGLFDPAQLTIFDPSQIAALLPLGDAMSPLDLLSAFSFENLQSVFSPETISFLPSLIDAPNAEAVQQLLSPEALANAMDDESPFAAIIEKARESANDMEDSPGFLAPGGQFMLPLFGAVEAPIALFNLLGSDAFNDAINQLTVETSS